MTAEENCTCTLGFSESKKALLKSLIKGNELKNPETVDLILRKAASSSLFDEIVVGDIITLNQFKKKIEDIVSTEILGDVVGE